MAASRSTRGGRGALPFEPRPGALLGLAVLAALAAVVELPAVGGLVGGSGRRGSSEEVKGRPPPLNALLPGHLGENDRVAPSAPAESPDPAASANSKMATLLLRGAAIVVAAAAVFFAMAYLFRESEPTLHILHINDPHSYLEPSFQARVKLPKEVADKMTTSSPGDETDDTTVRVKYGGMSRIAQAMQDHEAEHSFWLPTWLGGRWLSKSHTLRLHAGDAITGGPYWTWFEKKEKGERFWRGQADAEVMRAMHFDAFELGNHEFDKGDAALKQFLDVLTQPQQYFGWCGCLGFLQQKVRVLGANIRFGKKSPLRSSGVEERFMRTVGRYKVGVFGIDVEGKTMRSSSPDHGTTLVDELDEAKKQCKALRAEGADFVIMLSHCGVEIETRIAKHCEGLDLVIGGDSHTLMASPSDVECFEGVEAHKDQYPFPVINDPSGKVVNIAHAWCYGNALGHVKVQFKKNGSVIVNGKPIFMFDRDSLQNNKGGARLDEADARHVVEYLQGLGHKAISGQPEVEKVLAPFKKALSAKGANKVLAHVDRAMSMSRKPGEECHQMSPAQSWAHGGDVNQMFANMALERAREALAPDADVLIINSGGFRANIQAGEFTEFSLKKVLPFANTLNVRNVKGSVIKEVLEEAVKYSKKGEGSSGGFPTLAGMRCKINMTGDDEARVSEIKVRINGSFVALDDNKDYVVLSTEYLTSAGKNGKPDGKEGYGGLGQGKDLGKKLIDVIRDSLTAEAGSNASGVGAFPVPLGEMDYWIDSFIDEKGNDHSTVSYEAGARTTTFSADSGVQSRIWAIICLLCLLCAVLALLVSLWRMGTILVLGPPLARPASLEVLAA